MHRRDLVLALAASGIIAPARAGPIGASMSGGMDSGTRELAYGAAVRASQLEGDRTLTRLIISKCDWIAPEVDMKWDALEPRSGAWNFKPADRIVRFGRRHGISVRGHTLLWEQGTPRWVLDRLAARPDWSLIERYFDTVLTRYGPHLCEWDVINEPIDTEDGEQGIRRTAFQRAFGSRYIADSLRLARSHLPSARLLINEYSLEYDSQTERDRRHALLRLLERLLADNVPIDAVGMQAHLDLSKGHLAKRELTVFLREIDAMGLGATITELDVKESGTSAPLPLRDARVADHVRQYLDVALAESVVRGVVTWGLSDRDSWLQPESPASSAHSPNRGLPFDVALRPKPLHWEIQGAMKRHRTPRA